MARGHVTLRGVVPSYLQRIRVRKKASVPGVRSIDVIDLKVRAGYGTPSGDEPSL